MFLLFLGGFSDSTSSTPLPDRSSIKRLHNIVCLPAKIASRPYPPARSRRSSPFHTHPCSGAYSHNPSDYAALRIRAPTPIGRGGRSVTVLSFTALLKRGSRYNPRAKRISVLQRNKIRRAACQRIVMRWARQQQPSSRPTRQMSIEMISTRNTPLQCHERNKTRGPGAGARGHQT